MLSLESHIGESNLQQGQKLTQEVAWHFFGTQIEAVSQSWKEGGSKQDTEAELLKGKS